MTEDELPRRVKPRPYVEEHFKRQSSTRRSAGISTYRLAPLDDAANAPCSACGSSDTTRRLNFIEGIRISLCTDAAACSNTYRCSLSPEDYAVLVRLDITI